jgi:hypothetical protein
MTTAWVAPRMDDPTWMIPRGPSVESSIMMKTSKIIAAILIAGSAPWLTGPAAAAPMSQPLTMQDAATPSVETVQFRRWGGGWRGRGWWGPGVVAGAIIGGAVAASRPWYGPYGYADGYYADAYYAPPAAAYGYSYDPGYQAAPGYQGAPDSDDVAYCQQRFRSYDPATGTYLGYDGLRHACP